MGKDLETGKPGVGGVVNVAFTDLGTREGEGRRWYTSFNGEDSCRSKQRNGITGARLWHWCRNEGYMRHVASCNGGGR